MSSVSLRDQLQAGKDAAAAVDYPYIRRDKEVRARIITATADQMLIETVWGGTAPVRRQVTPEYFENNFWEGKN